MVVETDPPNAGESCDATTKTEDLLSQKINTLVGDADLESASEENDDDATDEYTAEEASLRLNESSKSNISNNDWFVTLGVFRIFGRCLSMIRMRWPSYLFFMILMTIVASLVGYAIFVIMLHWEDKIELYNSDFEDHLLIGSNLAVHGLKLAVKELLMFLIVLFGEAGMMGTVIKLYANIDYGNFYNDIMGVGRHYHHMFWAALEMFIAAAAICYLFSFIEIMLKMVTYDSILVIPLSILYLVLFCAYFAVWAISFLVFPIILVENLNAMQSIKRSWAILYHGRIWFVLCVNLSFATIRIICTDLLEEFVEDAVGDLSAVAFVVVYWLPVLLLLPVQANMRVVLYMNVRLENEDMDESTLLYYLKQKGGFLEAYGLSTENESLGIQASKFENNGDYVEARILMKDGANAETSITNHTSSHMK